MKIKKNLSDKDMLGNYKEEITFENVIEDEEITPKKPSAKNSPASGASEFLTPELHEKIGKALLELKVKLYSAGMVDYDLKVTLEDNKIILTPAPCKKPKSVRDKKTFV